MLQQDYDAYSVADHHTWSVLFNRQLEKTKKVAYVNFHTGLSGLDFQPHRIPDFNLINKKAGNAHRMADICSPGTD